MLIFTMQGPNGIIKGSYDPKNLSQDQRQWLYNQFGHQGNAPVGYGGEHVSGDSGTNYTTSGGYGPDQNAINQSQQNQYQDKINTAVGGLQTQKASLSDQYAELLKTVKGQYDPLINQETATAQAALAKRGLTPDSQLYQQQVQGALQPVYGAQAANAQQIGQGSINDINTLAQTIASVQVGAAGTSSQLPLQYGGLALQQQALPSQIAQALAQAKQAGYVQIPNYGVYDINQQQLIGGLNGVPGQGVTNVNGVPSVWVP